MSKQRTILVLGVCSILMLGAGTPVMAHPGLGGGHHKAQITKERSVLKVHHRQSQRNLHKRHWKKHRRDQRQTRRYGRDRHYHPDRAYRSHRAFNGNEFVGGLLFGGILGYVIGNDY